MNILSQLQSRKLGILELVSIGFDLYFKNFRLFLGFSWIVLLSGTILTLFFISLESSFSNSIVTILFILFFFFYLVVVVPIYTAAMSIITEDLVLGKRPQLQLVLRRTPSFILPLTWLNIRFGTNYLLRCLLLFIPGIIYLINNGFYATAFILRDQRGRAAFEYSKTLVKENWWRVFSFYLIVGLTGFILSGILTTILSVVIVNSPIIVAVLSNALTSLASLGFGVSTVLIFLNLEFQTR